MLTSSTLLSTKRSTASVCIRYVALMHRRADGSAQRGRRSTAGYKVKASQDESQPSPQQQQEQQEQPAQPAQPPQPTQRVVDPRELLLLRKDIELLDMKLNDLRQDTSRLKQDLWQQTGDLWQQILDIRQQTSGLKHMSHQTYEGKQDTVLVAAQWFLNVMLLILYVSLARDMVSLLNGA